MDCSLADATDVLRGSLPFTLQIEQQRCVSGLPTRRVNDIEDMVLEESLAIAPRNTPGDGCCKDLLVYLDCTAGLLAEATMDRIDDATERVNILYVCVCGFGRR